MTTDLTPLDFSAPDFLANPYPTYARLQREAPILYRQDWGLWFVSAYEDVNALLRDKRLGRAILHVLDRETLDWPLPDPARAAFDRIQKHSLMELEPPDHTRLKGLVMKAFSPRRVAGLRTRIEAVAEELLDRVAGAGHMELLADFAAPLSVTIIAELLGVPPADRPQLRPWSSAIVAMFELGGPSEAQVQAAVRAADEFATYLRELIAERRRRPQDDLLSDLVAVEAEGSRLTEAELISTCILILNAGHEATVNVLGNGVAALLTHPAQLARLRADPSLSPLAIEEMLRYDTPLPLFRRWVLADMTYKGHTFRQGAEVALLLGAANRDAQVFADPHTFDISRRDNPHLSFGAGIHYCLGGPLARLELQVGLQSLLRRCPDLRLATPALTYQPTFVFRGLTALPVEF